MLKQDVNYVQPVPLELATGSDILLALRSTPIATNLPMIHVNLSTSEVEARNPLTVLAGATPVGFLTTSRPMNMIWTVKFDVDRYVYLVSVQLDKS